MCNENIARAATTISEESPLIFPDIFSEMLLIFPLIFL